MPKVKKEKKPFSLTSTELYDGEKLHSTKNSSKINLRSSNLSLLESKESKIEPREPMGKRKLKNAKKLEREKTAGKKWFNVQMTEMTDEKKNDLDAIQYRAALNPKHLYKRNTMRQRPKYFHVGRVIEAPADFYHSRVPRKERKRTIAEEMMAEYNKQKKS